MFKSYTIFYCITAFLCFFLTACPNLGILSTINEDKEFIKDEAVNILKPSDSIEILAISELDPETQQMTISFDQESDFAEFQIGNIIAMGVSPMTPKGLLQKIQSVEIIDDQIIYHTRAASLDEAIEQCRIEKELKLQPSDIQASHCDIKGISFNDTACALDYNFSYKLNNAIIHDKNNSKMTLNGVLNFSLHPSLIIDIRDHHLEEINFEVKIEENCKLTLNSNMENILLIKPIEVYRHQFKPIFFTVSGFPIVILPQLSVSIGCDGKIVLNAAASVKQDLNITNRLFFSSQNNKWKCENEISDQSSSISDSIKAESRDRAFVGPNLDLLFYGLSGPYLNLKNYFQPATNQLINPSVLQSSGMDSIIGINLEPLVDSQEGAAIAITDENAEWKIPITVKSIFQQPLNLNLIPQEKGPLYFTPPSRKVLLSPIQYFMQLDIGSNNNKE